MISTIQVASFLSVPVFCITVSCTESKAYETPSDYDLKSPIVHKLETKLAEISGISFKPGEDKTIYAIEDEHANFYRLTPGGEVLGKTDFGKKGDYEDVAITSTSAFVLRSDGTIFSSGIPADEKDITSSEIKDILPSGEYEGLTAESDNSLIALCKNCKVKGTKGKLIFYRLNISGPNQLTPGEPIIIPVIESKEGDEKVKLEPSALAKNPVNGSWYIISSINKMLIVLDSKFEKPVIYNLDPNMFRQPEGICFDSKGTLYISNEAAGGTANILEFKRK